MTKQTINNWPGISASLNGYGMILSFTLSEIFQQEESWRQVILPILFD